MICWKKFVCLSIYLFFPVVKRSWQSYCRWWLRDIICSRSESDSEHIPAISIEVENSYIPFSVFWKNRKKQLINLKDIMVILLFGLIKVNWQYTKWNTKLKLISVPWKMCGLCWSYFLGVDAKEIEELSWKLLSCHFRKEDLTKQI